MNKITIAKAKSLTDREIISFLKDQWNVSENSPIIVYGKIRSVPEKEFYWLDNVKADSINRLEYPLSDISRNNDISSQSVYIPSDINKSLKEYIEINGESKGIMVRCELVLAYPVEREKYNNPILLRAVARTVKLVDEVKHTEIIKDLEGNILIEASIINSCIIKNKQKIHDETIIFEEKRIEAEKEFQDSVETYEKELAAEMDQKRKIAEKDQLGDLEAKRNALSTDITALEKTHTLDTINLEILKDKYDDQKKNNANKEDAYNVILGKIREKEEDKNSLNIAILALEKKIQLDKEMQMKKIEMFRTFVKTKADTLLKLEFIGEDEYNDILMIREGTKVKENHMDFHSDLDGDYSRAISHIQAYLFNQGIVYSRYIIEDYFALIKTNDLIILAGESGSGKTNLIKSFAKAVGGVSKIIPVKPNWTSSEDLLGYYNPLEKKYLSTPFLEALLEANRNPEIPYFICLDEMNLARVEYYFADFLSLLEERGEQPNIHLYSDDESSHVLSEFQNVLTLIESSKEKFNKRNIVNFVEILQDEEVNRELKRVFGFSDKDSLIKYHSDLRRMLSGILNTPSSIAFPKNVRIIGAINIDETTHYLSPKILDRAHIMKFDSPLLYDWDAISSEIDNFDKIDCKIKFNIDDFGTRNPYPDFDRTNDFTKQIVDFTKQFFSALGIEVGLRTIRQGLNYRDIFLQLNSDENLVLNNFIIHKILPKMVFDGSKKSGASEKKDILVQFRTELENILNEKISELKGIYSITELDELIEKSEANDWIVNYWA